ncbi:MAG: flavodoxin domain-containing protein [Oscillospiraceae bacterium]|nr:flavodoxin domain-containing protein [Oscillospiraceae bacterium]
MKTLILYATKHGAAADIAGRIAKHIDNAALHNLKQDSTPNLAQYDCIIVGSAVYAGMFRKEAKTFLAQHADMLMQKQLGLFASGLLPAEEQKIFADNVPPQLLAHAKAAMLLGGVFDPAKANFATRLAMKAATKQSGYVSTIDNDKIAEFAKRMLDG